MARPKKNNAEYFTHDSDMRDDVRIKAVRRKFSHTGYAVWNYLLETLTDADFFAIDFDDLTIELLAADYDITAEQLIEITDYCVKIGLLKKQDGKLFSVVHQERLKSVIDFRQKQRENGRKGGNPNFQSGKSNPYYETAETLPKDNPKITDPYVETVETLPRDKHSKEEKSKEEKSNISIPPSPYGDVPLVVGEVVLVDSIVSPNDTQSPTIIGEEEKKKLREKEKNEENFAKFKQWIADHAPNVAKLKEPFTQAEFERIRQEFQPKLVQEILTSMHNDKKLQLKYVSANLTLRNWIRIRKTKKKQTNEPTTSNRTFIVTRPDKSDRDAEFAEHIAAKLTSRAGQVR